MTVPAKWQGPPTGVLYLICQLERGESGTPHMQGYVQLLRAQPLTWVKNRISKTAHWEIMRAHDTDQARDYCRKEESRIGGPWEFGRYHKSDKTARGGRTKRSDIELFRDAIRSGTCEETLWDNFPVQMARFPQMYARLRVITKERDPPTVCLLYGDTGTGKTRCFFERSSDSWYVTPINNGTFWLDGYKDQEWVLFDDFSGQMQLVQLLRLLDRYPILVPIKGSHTSFQCAKYIYITTNIHPYNWYKWEGRQGQYDALSRRFTHVWDFNIPGTFDDKLVPKSRFFVRGTYRSDDELALRVRFRLTS